MPGQAGPQGLKKVSVDTWKEMLDLVNCKVLSVIESPQVDAYLLSESSLFVFPHKLVLKTCGTTTLLYGLPRILEIAALSADFPHVAADLVRGIPAAATPYRVFYSRKNFLYPDKQRGPHRSWRDEVRYLDKLFLGGSAYMIGKMNGEHWYLYITGPDARLTPPSTPHAERAHINVTDTKVIQMSADSEGHVDDGQEDETLEILMTDLDENNAKQFYVDDASAVAEGRLYDKACEARKTAIDSLSTISEAEPVGLKSSARHFPTKKSLNDDHDVFDNATFDSCAFFSEGDDLTFTEELTTEGHTLGTVVSECCGLSDLYPVAKYPDARIDAYLFTPCGFSANGVVPVPATSKAPGTTHYFTVHVTPEPQCSYASFETNVPTRQSGRQTADIVEHVVSIFRPGRFTVTLFEAKPTLDAGDAKPADREAAKQRGRMESIKGYRRVDRIVHDLDGYDLVFRYYERFDWKGGAPRLGEVGN